MSTVGNEIQQKFSNIFCCITCDYNTIRKCNYDTHLLSRKHKMATNGNKMATKIQRYDCYVFKCEVCKKQYKDRTGLWKHKSKGVCKQIEEIHTINRDIIFLLIKENSDFKNMMIEQQNKIMDQQNKVLEIAKNVSTHNTNINSNNKSFNLNFFLNETCKNAMNITDFVESLKLQVSDLERVGELGYIEGISNIIINNLKELDVTQRPVHCMDKKRETIYIKDENKWEKDEDNIKMHKLVKKVADKNARLLPKFKEKYPEYKKSSSKISDQYNKLLIESMGGSGENDYEKEEKIIKRVSKEVTIEKS